MWSATIGRRSSVAINANNRTHQRTVSGKVISYSPHGVANSGWLLSSVIFKGISVSVQNSPTRL